MSGHGGAEFLAPVYLAATGYYLWRIKNHKEIPGDDNFANLTHAWMFAQMAYNELRPHGTPVELDIAVIGPAIALIAFGLVRYAASREVGELIHIGMHLNNLVHTMHGVIYHLGMTCGPNDNLGRLIFGFGTDERVANAIDTGAIAFNASAAWWVMKRYLGSQEVSKERRLEVINLLDNLFHQLMFLRMGLGHAGSLAGRLGWQF